MADKPEFVDMISEATRQSSGAGSCRASSGPWSRKHHVSVIGRRTGGQQWRMETLTPWKLKSWKFKNWD